MIRIDSLRRAILGLLSPAGKHSRLAILTFHQVPRDPVPAAPDLAHAAVFAQQMQWLSDYCTVLPLTEAALRLRDGTLPARSACITFDDGYADNLEVAAPILRDLGLPATFFIAVDAVEQGIMWNDLVIEAVRQGQGEVDLTDLGFGEYYLTDDKARRSAITDVIKHLKYRPFKERWSVAESIHARIAGRPSPRLMMTADQVSTLADQGFDIGAHTVNHPILKELAPDDARGEIEASRDWVGDVTGRIPTTFSYPNGRPGVDFDASHEEMIRDAGFQVAVSTRWGCAMRDDSPFALPRFTPWERRKSAFWTRLLKTNTRSYLHK